MLSKKGDQSIVFPYLRQIECGKATALHPRIYGRTVGKKQFNCQCVPLIHSLMQRNPTAHITRIDIRTTSQKQLDNLDLPPPRRRMQRSVSRLGRRVRIHPPIQMPSHRLNVSIKGGLMNQHRLGCPAPCQRNRHDNQNKE